MKNFYISILILMAVTIFAVNNCLYINNVSNQLAAMAEKAESADINDAEKLVCDIEEYWHRERNRAIISVPYTVTDRVDGYIATLRSAASSQNIDEYKKALNQLRDAAEEISRLEKLSFSSIF